MSGILASIFTPILLSIAGIVGSAIFSGLETGLYVVDRVRLAVRAGRGDASAVQLEGPERKRARCSDERRQAIPAARGCAAAVEEAEKRRSAHDDVRRESKGK